MSHIGPDDKIEKRIELSASPERVWRALTDYREFGEWFRVALEGPFVPGGRARGQILHPGFEHVVMDIEVGEMQAPRYFSFYWHPYAIDPAVDYSVEKPTLVEFVLEPTEAGTLLVVTESGFEAVPAARRDEAFRMNDGGWAAQVENIARHVSENP